MSGADRLFDVQLDDRGLPPPSPQEEQERRVAVFDLAESNTFAMTGGAATGPFALRLSIDGNRLQFDLTTQAGAPAGAFELSLVKFRRVARDYFQICESYQDAVKHAPPAQIERFDAARSAIHEDGAATLRAELAPHATIDMGTARRLFTLICVLFPKVI